LVSKVLQKENNVIKNKRKKNLSNYNTKYHTTLLHKKNITRKEQTKFRTRNKHLDN